MLTIEKVKELARKNYCKGGDIIVECYEDKEIQELIDNGIDTEEKLLKMFRERYEIDEEYRKAALYHAYGTTDEEKIKEMLNIGSEDEPMETEEEDDELIDDPCYGCQAYDGGYNCKHCPHGDDGNYSVYDVYRPSELL